MNTQGIVTSIDRDAGTVDAIIGDAVVPGVAYMGEAPWPLAVAWFFNGPAWVCLGPAGDKRTIVHDDFMYSNLASTPSRIGDTGWIEGGSGGSITTVNDVTDAVGSLRVTATDADTYYLRKSNRRVLLNPERVYWLTARFRPNNDTEFEAVDVGLSDDVAGSPTSLAFVLLAEQDGNNIVGVASGASDSSVDTGESVETGIWTWVDLMIAPGQWAAGWVDGSGPWIVTENVPDDTTQAVTPYFQVQSLVGDVSADLDVITLAIVELQATANPTELDLP